MKIDSLTTAVNDHIKKYSVTAELRKNIYMEDRYKKQFPEKQSKTKFTSFEVVEPLDLKTLTKLKIDDKDVLRETLTVNTSESAKKSSLIYFSKTSSEITEKTHSFHILPGNL